jgi:purine-binding chemotaxis protein CheW
MTRTSRQFCTFHVGNLFLGIEVQQVQEVIRSLDMTRVPLASAAISGLINLRGQIVTAIDLRRRLQMTPRTPAERAMNVVVRDGENAVSLQVDRIGDVLTLEDDLFELPPSTVPADVRGLILGAYKLPGRLLLVLNTKLALTDDDSSKSRETRRAS